MPEQQLSNHFACWHTHDTPLRFIWELSRFLISLHLSWLYFDKTALDKSIFFFPLLCLTAPMMHLGNTWGSSSRAQLWGAQMQITAGSGCAPGMVAGKAQLCCWTTAWTGTFPPGTGWVSSISCPSECCDYNSRVQRCDLVLSLLKAVGQLGFMGQRMPLNTLRVLISSLPTSSHSLPGAQVMKHLSVQLSPALPMD